MLEVVKLCVVTPLIDLEYYFKNLKSKGSKAWLKRVPILAILLYKLEIAVTLGVCGCVFFTVCQLYTRQLFVR